MGRKRQTVIGKFANGKSRGAIVDVDLTAKLVQKLIASGAVEVWVDGKPLQAVPR